jgi:hypothetical protein
LEIGSKKERFFQPICRSAKNTFAAGAVLFAAVDHACLALQPYADMRGKAQMRHQHQRAVSGRHQAARPVRHLAPGPPLGVRLDRFQDPALWQIRRHRDARQLAAEQFPLHMAGEIPAVAGLPGPRLADQRGKNIRSQSHGSPPSPYVIQITDPDGRIE